jgi:prepilin-type N-terminal cleavage/methylation domain-containing protein
MKKFSTRTSGFTLIELLVVISIIGLLSSIVLVALNAARQKGTNARITEEVSQIRNALEINRNSDGTYSTNTSLTLSTNTCFTNASLIDPLGSSLVTDIAELNGGSIGVYSMAPPAFAYQTPPVGVAVFTNANSLSVCSSAGLSTIPSKIAVYAAFGSNGSFSSYFCSDSSGNSTTGNIVKDISHWNTFWNNVSSAQGTCI